MKAFLIFLALVFCVAANLLLPAFINFPPWYSFVVHFAVGGVLFSYFVACFYPRPIEILAGDALGGVLWEVFEYWYSQGEAAFSGNGAWFYQDTIWDFQMNLFGAIIVALIYYVKRI